MNPGDHQPGRASLFEVRTFRDPRGALSVVEEKVDLPFAPRRLFYLHGAGPGVTRGAHAHRRERQCMIALSGTVEVEVDDGRVRNTFVLERPDQGLLIDPVAWVRISFRDAGAVLCVLASQPYDAEDYIREYSEFQALVGAQ